jgi:catechol 2,3-dioxygenase-like lactoylglutathione lyase family enzyme/glycerol uptake facilitator-like aquaporin
MLRRLARNWPEYAMEAAELALFMVSACLVVALLEHPHSPVAGVAASPHLRRVLTGLAMGATAIAIVYSPWGQRSGAHFNPAVTLTFLRLGKIDRIDALFYAAAHFAGGALGVLVGGLLLSDWIAHPAVAWVATRPGPHGAGIAFAAEVAISFAMMSMILAVSSHPRLGRYTGLFAGAAVATFIAVEAPLSGMSMNPARSFGPALIGGRWDTLWLYFAAPLAGMLLAAEVRLRRLGRRAPGCAKLVHARARRCIFCGHRAAAGPGRTTARRAAAALLLFLLCAALVASQAARSHAAAASAVQGIGPIGMTVADADRSIAFYREVLSFEKVSDVELWGDEVDRLQGIFALRMRVVRMRLGDEEIVLNEYLTPRGRPVPVDSRSHDRWFQHVAIIVSDMDRAYARLREHRVEHASPAPQTLPRWNPKAGGIRAFYFKDPDGHPLEILEFPPDKGDARWHRPTEDVFLGIDHTAIAVGDTAASLRFYRDVLGLQVAGESENHGGEQERLNAVFGARLRITTLRAASGPGIELLEYLSPRDGRPIPADQRPNDLAHWQTTLLVDDPEQISRRLREDRAAFLSAGVVAGLPEGFLGLDRAFLVRDPDGHALQIGAAARLGSAGPN